MPVIGFAEDVPHGVVLQSRDDTCVPAAAASLLRSLNVYTTEVEMARLTRVRSGLGTTPVRALHGIERRLAGTPYHARLVQVPVHDLPDLPMPLLATMRLAGFPPRQHMVVVEARHGSNLHIIDPACGRVVLAADDFVHQCTGVAILVTRRAAW